MTAAIASSALPARTSNTRLKVIMAVANVPGLDAGHGQRLPARDAGLAVFENVITVAVLALVATRLVSALRVALRGPARNHIAYILRGLRPRHFVRAPFVFTAVVAVIVVLYTIPLLRIGWWTLIGGTGNII